ncbi:ATP-binding cassette domain-containing protein [Sulfurovum sp. bin170]|uniref:ABC transporter ATP-binding protein n=1 Tax=Sulfurovum sp. bin170 TaxID=2695268 RepID=UPI0013E0AFC7|nr:ATP-binding cassette domain-containing protein [Sulfurovum sp. bin170]NEW60740.1 ATP-binding cassette domain-containing protein [Sulfurovum sp. bin170]
MSTPLLKATNIAHSFDYQLFTDVDFELQPQESIAILGRSGCGKSTLLHIFSSFIVPNEGEVHLLGHNLYRLRDEEIEQIRRDDLGIVFQAHYLFKGMKAIENLEIATLLSNETIDDKLLEQLEIKELMEQKIGELSGGQQQRISIARVLSKKPKIIFADEPTGNLDRETGNLVMRVLLDYIKENSASMVLVTHDENMAKLCDKRYILENKNLEEF